MRSLIRLFALVTALTAASAQAASFIPYTDERFEALNGQNKPVIVEVYADWCPTCRNQRPALEKVSAGPAYAAYTVLIVDYDKQPKVMERFGITRQSTLVIFAGGKERARSTGVVDPADIATLLDSGL